jgi:serine/threonine-protein kinase SRPK3
VIIGDLLQDRYKVVRKLSWDQLSTLWLCKDLEQQKFVTLKVVKSAAEHTEAALHEIQLLKCVRESDELDPFRERCLQLLDDFKITGVNGTHVCMVFDVHTDSLSKLVIHSQGKGLRLFNVKLIMKQVLEGLHYLHTKCKIIHTNITPENVLLCPNKNQVLHVADGSNVNHYESVTKETPDLRVKLSDFGNGSWIKPNFTNDIQTNHYQSLEAVIGAEFGPPAEIWSAACLAFELASGIGLFDSPKPKKMSAEEVHLSDMIELMGPIPFRIAMSGKKSTKFFNEKGELKNFPLVPQKALFVILTDSVSMDPEIAQSFADWLLPMLAYDPKDRPTAKQCLSHRFFDDI